MGEPEPLRPAPVVAHADRLARGALLQQGAQIARLIGGLAVVTILVRTLPAAEYGVYAVLLSFVTYVQFIKASVMNAAVLGVAESSEDSDRLDGVVSTGFAIYAALGVVAAAALAIIGLLALPILEVPEGLEDPARTAVIGLALTVAIGWPVQIFDDLLRGLQRFAAVSVLELMATILFVGGIVALVLVDAPVWAFVSWNAAIPGVTGLCCLVALPRMGLRVTLAPRHVHLAEARRFGRIAGLMSFGGVADLATYSVDRVILSANRGPAAVTLYEGPLQVQNMIRFLNGVLVQPSVATGRRFIADGDEARLRALFLRGLRYSLAVTMPLVVVGIVLAGPLVTVWLGPSFQQVATETAVFCSWWLIGVNGGLAGVMLAAGGRFRLISGSSWLVGAINLPLALILTPQVGLWGPIAAAMVAFIVSVAIQFPAAVRLVGVTWLDVGRTAWIPAYSTAAIVAFALVGVRLVVDIDGLALTALVAGGGAILYWLIYAALWFSRDEWALARRTLLMRRTAG